MASEKNLFFAKLAEQAERYDDMRDYMESVGRARTELTVEERNLISVGFKNAVGSRRASWRAVSTIELKELAKGNTGRAAWAQEFRERIESELQELCESIIGLLESSLIPDAIAPEAKVFYRKMKADYHRYIAEFSFGDAKIRASEDARRSYEEASAVAAAELAETNPIRLGLALNYSVFQYEVLQNQKAACKMVRKAFEDAIAGLDNVPQDSYKDSTLIMQLLRDNLTLWTSDEDVDSDASPTIH